MARLRDAARREFRPLVAFGAGWVTVWVVTVFTWETDAAGASVGMWQGAIALHVVLPLWLGSIVGVRSGLHKGSLLRACLGLAAIFSLIHGALFVAFDTVLWSNLVTEAANTVIERLAIAVGYLVLAMGLSVVGGVAGRRWTHRWVSRPARGRDESSDPAVPAVLAGEQPRRIEDLLR